MTSAPPATQRDVARACGVHPSTICLALKNSPSIPLLTRQRVQAVAEELGYRPNVAARNLALLRGDKQSGSCLPIAWINQEPQRNHWRRDPEASGHFENARRRAAELGYHLEDIWVSEPGMSVARIVQIIRARGIEGVVIPVHHRFEFSLLGAAWNDFAIVGLNDHRLSEWVDTVCPDHYRNMDTILRQLRRLGYAHIGLALTTQFDAASSGLVHSCFLRHQSDISSAERIPLCTLADSGRAQQAAFEQWFQEHRPEVVVTTDAGLVSAARENGLEALWVGLGAASWPFDAGIDDAAGDVAGAAVDWLVGKMRRFEKGTREATRVQLLKGSWMEPQVVRLERETAVVA